MTMFSVGPMRMLLLLKLTLKDSGLIWFCRSSDSTLVERALFAVVIWNVIEAHLLRFLLCEALLFVLS